jgi:hypothetical protein
MSWQRRTNGRFWEILHNILQRIPERVRIDSNQRHEDVDDLSWEEGMNLCRDKVIHFIWFLFPLKQDRKLPDENLER